MRFSTGKCGFLAVPLGCLLSAAAALVCFASTSSANDGPTSNELFQRAGLTVDWFSHTGVGPAQSLVDWHLNVDENNQTTYFTIKAGKYREKFSQNTLDGFGQPFGVEKAREYATLRTDILKAEFENDGIKDVDIQVSEYSLPETIVYALTSNAVVKAIDGDSGKVKWSVRVGQAELPSIGLGSSKSLVAVVNGSTLYCLDSKTGKTQWSKRCRYAPSASPSVGEETIYVPLLDGKLEVFELANEGEYSTTLVAKGRGTARPVTTEKTVAWPTIKGEMNVAALYGRKRGVAYQLHADNSIVAPPAYNEGMFFVTSLDGFVYALDEERGTVAWQVSTGHAVSQPAITLGNYVFVINNGNEMYKMDAKTGWDAPGWEKPIQNIGQFVGAGKENMYVVDRFGNLMVISQDSGNVLSSVAIGSVDKILPNLESDRLYFVNKQGMMQCVREIGSPIPHFHSNEYVAVDVEKTAPDADADGAGQAKPTDTDLDDPFGGGAKKADDVDPFGGGAKTEPAPDDTANPFGGADKGAAGAGAGTTPDDDDPFK